MANKRHIKLKTIGDVSAFLSKIINQFYRGEIEGPKASKLGYLCNILIGSLKDSQLEERVKALEESMAKRK
ncbi:hypothetical protein JW835_07075 [bacterium]|nr:hypothetical protein [bacterium]